MNDLVTLSAAVLVVLVIVVCVRMKGRGAGTSASTGASTSFVDGAGKSYPARSKTGYSPQEQALLRTSYKNAQQHLQYTRASERARAEGRQLVVIGNPSGGWVNKVVPMYGCGDVCIDIGGCEPCPGEEGRKPRIFKGDVLDGLRTVRSNSAVVFESEVFEYPTAAEFPAVLQEVDRITGGDLGRVFAVHSVGLGGASWGYHKGGAPPPRPSAGDIAARRQDRLNYHKTLGEGLARRIIYRYPPHGPYEWADL
jgi:hypothetical protein